jgi:hypothetical protein
VWSHDTRVCTAGGIGTDAARFLYVQAIDKHGSSLLSFLLPKTNQHKGTLLIYSEGRPESGVCTGRFNRTAWWHFKNIRLRIVDDASDVPILDLDFA